MDNVRRVHQKYLPLPISKMRRNFGKRQNTCSINSKGISYWLKYFRPGEHKDGWERQILNEENEFLYTPLKTFLQGNDFNKNNFFLRWLLKYRVRQKVKPYHICLENASEFWKNPKHAFYHFDCYTFWLNTFCVIWYKRQRGPFRRLQHYNFK